MNEIKPIPPIAELRVWLQARLAGMLERKAADVALDADFHDLGLDSVGYLNLAIGIEEELDIPIMAKEIFLHRSVAELADFLVSDGPSMMSRSRRRPKGAADYTTVSSGGDLAPLFWLNGYEFLELAAPHLPPERPVFYLHHQGSDGKPAQHHSMEAMTDFYIDTILHLEPDGPYCIGGFSIGGTLAHEIACRLEAMGKQVELLMLLSPAGNPRSLKEAFARTHRERASTLGGLGGKLYMTRKYLGLYSRLAYDKLRKLRNKAECYRYFLTRRPLPSRLIWNHVQPIYAKALQHYEISSYGCDTILATERTITVEEWRDAAEGLCRVLPRIPLRHLEILMAEHAHLWLDDFIAPLGVAAGEASGETGGASSPARARKVQPGPGVAATG